MPQHVSQTLECPFDIGLRVHAVKPGCLQVGPFQNNLSLNPWGISEDWQVFFVLVIDSHLLTRSNSPHSLYLNVYTPYVPSDSPSENSPALKPVLLWVHGGANLNGLGSDATFDGGPLASRTDSVIVTINYRLNIFGFVGLNDGVITGNYALTDKIASLQWVKDNIAAFGGDPEKVTIFGQSAGGWSIVDLLRSPPAKGLFSGAISQSGGSGTFVTAQQAADAAGAFNPFACLCVPELIMPHLLHQDQPCHNFAMGPVPKG